MAVSKVDAIQLAREHAEPFWGTDLSHTAVRRMALEVGVDRLEMRTLAADAVQIPRPDGGHTIFLNSKQTRLRHRFSLAHEVAHILLEPLAKDSVTHRKAFAPDQDPNFKRIERICDAMAAEILMPEPKFVKAADEMGWTLGTAAFLATRFDVSLEAATRRFVDLFPEPCTLVRWKLNSTSSAVMTKPPVSARVKNLRGLQFVTEGNQPSREMQATYQNGGQTTTTEVIRLVVGRTIQSKQCLVESMCHGNGQWREVYSFVYMDQHSKAGSQALQDWEVMSHLDLV